MVVPYRRVAELEDLHAEESAELMAFTQKAIRVMKSVSKPDGFNVGLNLGRSAGGSLAEHLHMHIVPRWSGDANFITVIGDAKVIPQLNVFVVGFPLNIAVGFFVLAAAQPFTIRLLTGSFADLEPALAGLLRAFG